MVIVYEMGMGMGLTSAKAQMVLEVVIQVVVEIALGHEGVGAVGKFLPVMAQPVVVVAEDRAPLERPLPPRVVLRQRPWRPGRRHVRPPPQAFFRDRVDVGEALGVLLFGRAAGVGWLVISITR